MTQNHASEAAQSAAELIWQFENDEEYPADESEMAKIIEPFIDAALAEKDAEIERAENYAATFHERIYDPFTCPNCRGRKTQYPGFFAETNELVACEFCAGEGVVTLAGIMDGFVSAKDQAAEIAQLQSALESLLGRINETGLLSATDEARFAATTLAATKGNP